MERKYLFYFVLVSLLCLVSATEYSVCLSSCDFPTISAAISSANEGDSIIVLSGTYNENIVISKKLTIIGQDAIISGKSPVVYLNADGVILNGFYINPIDESGISIQINYVSDYSISGNLLNGSIIYGLGDIPKTSVFTGSAVANVTNEIRWIWLVVGFVLIIVLIYIFAKRNKKLNKKVIDNIKF